MHLIFFTHPSFSNHQSMPRFAGMLAEGMKARGHNVEIWAPQAKFFDFPSPRAFKKWLGYIDQFLVFPTEVRRRLKSVHQDTLFVFTDHALGPWLNLVAQKPNVIHCHDFLAQLSAKDLIAENRTGWSGKKYQSLIRKGYSKGRNFISVSHKTNKDLHSFLNKTPQVSKVVYNGLNRSFLPKDPEATRKRMSQQTGIPVEKGYILHVGGNQWYKNRIGVIEIFNAWRSEYQGHLPLILVGETPSEPLRTVIDQSPFRKSIYILNKASDDMVQDAYAGATAFLFPSLAEGFGWPIAEAMASGCPVITTGEAPMTEVAEDAAFYISKLPYEKEKVEAWAANSAAVLNKVIHLDEEARKDNVRKGLVNVNRFDHNKTLDKIEGIYKNVLDTHGAL